MDGKKLHKSFANVTPITLGTCPCSLQFREEIHLGRQNLSSSSSSSSSHPIPSWWEQPTNRSLMAAQTLSTQRCMSHKPHCLGHPLRVLCGTQDCFYLWARLRAENMSLVVPASSIPGTFPQKGCSLRGACPHCLAAVYLCGNLPGARREGKGPHLAQLILPSVGRKPGAGGSPGFPLGQRWARFISTQPSLCTTENKLPPR